MGFAVRPVTNFCITCYNVEHARNVQLICIISLNSLHSIKRISIEKGISIAKINNEICSDDSHIAPLLAKCRPRHYDKGTS